MLTQRFVRAARGHLQVEVEKHVASQPSAAPRPLASPSSQCYTAVISQLPFESAAQAPLLCKRRLLWIGSARRRRGGAPPAAEEPRARAPAGLPRSEAAAGRGAFKLAHGSKSTSNTTRRPAAEQQPPQSPNAPCPSCRPSCALARGRSPSASARPPVRCALCTARLWLAPRPAAAPRACACWHVR